MKYLFTILTALCFLGSAHAQFSSVSTNLVGWATGNANVAVDVNLNRQNTLHFPVSFSPVRFGSTQWRNITLQPAWRHWLIERYVGHFVSPSLIYSNFTVGHGKYYYKGMACGVGFSWGYSVLLSTRWNFLVELGAGVVYAPYTERLYDRYVGEFDDEYTYRHHRVLVLPTKCNLSFSYLF